MIVDFSISNFRSIAEEQTLTLEATVNKKNSSTSSLITTNFSMIPHLYKTSVIFGANASGKSNLLKGLKFFLDLIKNSTNNDLYDTQSLSEKKFTFERDIFRLDPVYTGKNTTFSISFISSLDDNQGLYTYSISLNDTIITNERLEVVSFITKRTTLLIDRSENNLRLNKEVKNKLGDVENNLLDNQLLLTYIARKSKNNYLDHIFDQLVFDTCVFLSNRFSTNITNEMINNEELKHITKEVVLNFIKASDINIQGLELEKKDVNLNSPTMPLKDTISNDVNNSDQPINNINLFTLKKDINNEFQKFTFDDAESKGTELLYGIAGLVLHALHEGQTLFIDELDSSMHPQLVKFIVNIFEDPSINKKNAQLIITSHTDALMDLGLNIEQLFITKLDNKKSTELYSLAEFKSSTAKSDRNKNLSYKYLSGMFGGTPNIDLLKMEHK